LHKDAALRYLSLRKKAGDDGTSMASLGALRDPEYDKGELELLADALGLLIDLGDLNHVQTQGTRDAIGNLHRIRDTVVFPQLAKPQLFLAFSDAADQEVSIHPKFIGLRSNEGSRVDKQLEDVPPRV
jgi:hypothetical protein